MPLAAGGNFGPYRVVEPLGRGGMASVYTAYEPGLDRYVALKVLPAEFLHDPDFADRFRREAKVIAKLEHARIVPIYGFGIDERIPWMAMRLVGGGALSSLLKKGLLEHGRAIQILAECAEALEYAHKHGILHRDVKPQNILLDTDGHVYLADFGIAKMVESSMVFTKTGMIQGTPQYMAPEQAQAEGVDHRTDIYALGIVAYEMFTGRLPFTADTPVAVLMKHVMEPIPLPDPTIVPESLLRPLLKCLAKNRDDRWPSASAFVSALQAPQTPALTASQATDPGTRTIATTPSAPPHATQRRPRDSSVPASGAYTYSQASAGGSRQTASQPPLATTTRREREGARPRWLGPIVGMAIVTAAATITGLVGLGLRNAPEGTQPMAPATTVPLVVPTTSTLSAPSSAFSPTPPPTTLPLESRAATPRPAATARPTDFRPAPSPGPSTTLPQVAEGSLRVVVIPWADVSVDGTPVTTGGRIPLPVGQHVVQISHPDYEPFQRKVTIKGGETSTLTIDLPEEAFKKRR